MSDVNKAIILGRLGFDPEAREAKAGTKIAQLRIATNEWSGSGAARKERTEWHRVTLFGRLAEIARDYLKRGALVYVEGRLRTSEWFDKEGKKHRSTEIVGDVMRMLDGRGANRSKATGPSGEKDVPEVSKDGNGDLFGEVAPRRAA